jgi:hypothetical protein
MKKILFLAFLLAASSSQACTFKTADSDFEREIVRQHGGYPISDAACNFLNQQGLALAIRGDATVLGGRSIAWVNVSLTKLGTGVTSDTYRYLTRTGNRASQDAAEDLFYGALTEAIGAFEFSKAANEVNRYLAKN